MIKKNTYVTWKQSAIWRAYFGGEERQKAGRTQGVSDEVPGSGQA